jgi:hypothetical protein
VCSIDPRRSFFRSIGPKLTVVALGLGLLLLVVAPVALAECPLTDPSCLTDDSIDTEAPPLPTAPPNVDDVTRKVDDAVDGAKDAAGNAVGQVTDAVDGILNPGKDPGGGDGSGGSGDAPSGGSGGGKAGGPGGISTRSTFQEGRSFEPTRVSPTPTSARTRSARPGLFGRVGGAAVEIGKRLSFPLALALVVVAFVILQNYLDRKDPKLALAPIRAEVMRFE